MKIILLTTGPEAGEIIRIKEEINKLDYDLEVINFTNFSFEIDNNNLSILQLKNVKADLAIVRGMFLSMNSVTPIIDFIKNKKIKVFDNGVYTHKYSINKVSDLVKLSLAGIDTPDTFYSKMPKDFIDHAEKVGYPLVVKSAKMGKGESVSKVNSKEELEKYINNVTEENKFKKTIIMQEFIPYKFDLRVFVLGDHIYTMRRIPPKGDFRANFSIGGTVELFDLSTEHKTLAKNAAKAVGLDIAGVDLLIKENGEAVVLEVNHTPGMMGIEEATGENITKMYVEYALNNAN
jgi:RimK family alpha-L-glutamate ligase